MACVRASRLEEVLWQYFEINVIVSIKRKSYTLATSDNQDSRWRAEKYNAMEIPCHPLGMFHFLSFFSAPRDH